MRIAEIYSSFQGEGLLAGTPSVFVRTSGCNLRCWYCDTPYSSWQPEGEDLSVEEIVAQVQTLDPRHVVITGGEPMLWAELVPLTGQLRRLGYHLTVETAGTLWLPIACDLMSISPKMSNSGPDPRRFPRWAVRHRQSRNRPAIVRKLCRRYAYQLKFVIDQPPDVAEVVEFLRRLPPLDADRVLLMPQGTSQGQLERVGGWLEPRCQALGFQFCARRHIEWFGAVRGT